MSKLLYAATMSLDGFIAGPDGDMSWLAEVGLPDVDVDGLKRRSDEGPEAHVVVDKQQSHRLLRVDHRPAVGRG